MAAKPKPRIPHKLERFLLTIARRRSVESVAVALFVMFDGAVVLGGGGALPARMLAASGINAAIEAMMLQLGVDGDVRYLGFCDRGKKRQYNFAVDLKSRPRLNHGFALKDADAAAALMERKDAKVLMGSFGRPPALQQMLVW